MYISAMLAQTPPEAAGTFLLGIVDSAATRGLLSKENQPRGIRSNRTKQRFADSFSGVVDYIVDYGMENRRGRHSVVD